MGLNEGNLFKEMPILLLFLNMLQEFVCFVAHTHTKAAQRNKTKAQKNRSQLFGLPRHFCAIYYCG